LSLFQELKRRNVFRVAAAYIIVGWLLLQVSDTLVPALHLPEWFNSGVAFILIMGFPIALILAWAYEITPDGLKKEHEVDRSQSITGQTGRTLDRAIIAVLILAVLLLAGKLWFGRDTGQETPAVVTDRSIAVLPFENRSADKEDAGFFAAGVHDELLTLLSKISDLKVISRTSVENLDPGLSIPEIGTLLDVATVLEGQVQRAGNRLRINMQLIDAGKEDHLWATTYDRELTAENVFDVQSDIARTIADALHAELSSSDEALLNTVPTHNMEAFNLYLLGRQQHDRGSFESFRQAERNFRQATELDPDYYAAWVAIADNANQMYQTGLIGLPEYIAAATHAIERALAIDTRMPEAHAQKANLNWHSGDLEAAEAAFRHALDLRPAYSQTLASYGAYLRHIGRPGEAIPILEQALRDDPLSTELLFNLGKAEMYAGNPHKNVEYSEKIRQIDPTSVYGYLSALQAYLWLGRFDLMWPWYLKYYPVDPADFEMWAHQGYFAYLLGAPQWGDRYFERALELGPDEPAVLKCRAYTLVQQGRFPEALELAQQALEADLDDRWFSRPVFLRIVRDDALQTGNFGPARQRYLDVHPELFENRPTINVNTIYAAADLALLLNHTGETEQADRLIQSGLDWYRQNQPATMHGYLTSIVDVSLLALSGDDPAALKTLGEAVEQGWKYDWRWHITNPNLDSIRDTSRFRKIEARLERETAEQLAAIRALPDMGEYDLRGSSKRSSFTK
jgi:TolB-like protein/Tfp pilus assembly protein PilF